MTEPIRERRIFAPGSGNSLMQRLMIIETLMSAGQITQEECMRMAPTIREAMDRIDELEDR